MTPYRVVDGRQVRAIRAILGMTQKELGAATGVNRNSILRAEKQERLPPRSWAAEMITKFAAEKGIICGEIDGQPVIRIGA